jgi:hypothetical protein
MKERRLCYISRTYYNQTSAGNKAKTDYEKVLHSMGAASIGLPCKIDNNKILAFFYNLASTLIACSRIQKGDVIVLQYPVKKYFSFICKMAHLKGAKTISLIHDLGSFRRKKLTVAQELKRLSHTDYIIATNQAMKLWLEQQGLEKPIGALGFHDYLSPSVAADKKHQPNEVWNIVYAGSLNLRKNAFILKMQELDYQFKFHLYGNMEDYDAVAKDKNIVWHGFMNADGHDVIVCGEQFAETRQRLRLIFAAVQVVVYVMGCNKMMLNCLQLFGRRLGRADRQPTVDLPRIGRENRGVVVERKADAQVRLARSRRSHDDDKPFVTHRRNCRPLRNR